MRTVSAFLCLAREHVTITCLFFPDKGKQDIMRNLGRRYVRNETYQMCLSTLLSSVSDRGFNRGKFLQHTLYNILFVHI